MTTLEVFAFLVMPGLVIGMAIAGYVVVKLTVASQRNAAQPQADYVGASMMNSPLEFTNLMRMYGDADRQQLIVLCLDRINDIAAKARQRSPHPSALKSDLAVIASVATEARVFANELTAARDAHSTPQSP